MARLEDQLASLGEHLGLLLQAARELPGDEGPLSADPDFRRRATELELALLAIRALSERARLAADAASAVSLNGVVEIRLAQARGAMAELVVAAFGYYALPDPDPLLIDNEGPIGHHRALALMRAFRSYFEPDARGGPGGETYGHKSRIAEQIFPST